MNTIYFLLTCGLGEAAASILDSLQITHEGFDQRINGFVVKSTTDQMTQYMLACPDAKSEVLIPMQSIAIAVDSVDERDYDTAIDICYYHMDESREVFKLPYGGLATIYERSSSTTRSYLEPDFTLFEKTGEVVYLEHESEKDESEEDESKFVSFGSFLVPNTKPKSNLGNDGEDDWDEDDLPYSYGPGNSKVWGAMKGMRCATIPMPAVTLHYELVPESVAVALASEYCDALAARNKELLDQMCKAALFRIEAAAENAYRALNLI